VRGQAVVEMAIITPLLLLFVLGTFQVGLAVLTATRLQHAAQQGAAAGAGDPAPPQRCPTAESVAAAVYDDELDAISCSHDGSLLELILTDAVPMVSPFGPFSYSASARAATP
jgi:Flp pilus assembly protein TadG